MSEHGPERVFEGIAASPGVAHGPAFVILQQQLEIPVFKVDASQRERQVVRFEEALLKAREQILEVRKAVEERLGEDEARIFDAHLLVVEDRALIEETVREVRESGYNIEYCFREVSNRFIEGFSQIDDAYVKERVQDIEDVSRRVLSNLLGETVQTFSQLGSQHIIVSEDIPPSDAATLEAAHVLGVAIDVGSRTSHAVIMARSYGIPAVAGLHDITSQVENDDIVLVDGYDGLVYVNPTEETLFRYGQLREERRSIERVFKRQVNEPSRTRDGRSLLLCANIGRVDECELALANGAEGVGLYRTEAFYLAGDHFPEEQEQYLVYRQIAEAMAPRPVVMRTLDMGGDKQFANVAQQMEEDNPFMGFRAIRFCLEHTDIFTAQLRAILRASAVGNVKIMFPMISSMSELHAAKNILESCKRQLRDEDLPFDEAIEVGSMIEIPSAAIIADNLAGHCDFFSIGTNDLIQYLLAVDRVNDRIAHLYQPSHPAVLRTVHMVIEAATRRNIPVSVCGEMAADPLYVPFFIGAGATSISVAAAALPEIKYLIRSTDAKTAAGLVKQVLNSADAATAQRLLHDFFHDVIGGLMPKGYLRNDR